MNESLRRSLVGFLRKRVRDEATAEDLAQDVLLRAHQRRATLRNPARWRSWLFAIARRVLIDHYRRRKTEEPLPESLTASAPPTNDQQELARCVEPLLAQLPATYRDAVTAVDLNGVTQRDYAAQQALSVSGAKSRVQRGRALLADAFFRCCELEQDRTGNVIDWRQRAGGCRC